MTRVLILADERKGATAEIVGQFETWLQGEVDHVEVPTTEDQPAIFLEPRHGNEVELGKVGVLRKMMIEGGGDQPAIGLVAPPVIGTDEISGTAGITPAKLCAAVPATVQQRAYFTVNHAYDDDGRAPEPPGDVIAGIRNLAFMAQVNPASVEYPFQLIPIYVIAGKSFAADESLFDIDETVGWRLTHNFSRPSMFSCIRNRR